MKTLLIEIKNCIGYGYMCYVEFEAAQKLYDFLNNFCMWGGSTKTYKNYKMYEMPENTIHFMQTDTFKSFAYKHNIEVITSEDNKFAEAIKNVFD